MTPWGGGERRTQQRLHVCEHVGVYVCVSSTAAISDVVPDVDREWEEEQEGGTLGTLGEGVFDFNMLQIPK